MPLRFRFPLTVSGGYLFVEHVDERFPGGRSSVPAIAPHRGGAHHRSIHAEPFTNAARCHVELLEVQRGGAGTDACCHTRAGCVTRRCGYALREYTERVSELIAPCLRFEDLQQRDAALHHFGIQF